MPWTRDDQRAAQRQWYARNRRKQHDWVLQRIHDMKTWLTGKKQMCRECGECRTGCLLFHHVDSSAKEADLSEAVNRGWSKERIERELAYCIVLCGNCHAKLHWNERLRARRGW